MSGVQPSATDILKWTKALRSGEYKQGFGRLESVSGFCCLGVACDLFIPADEQVREPAYGCLIGGTPSTISGAPLWLAEVNHLFAGLTASTLSDLNDSHDFSFDEIADLLEAVFVHRVLDEAA